MDNSTSKEIIIYLLGLIGTMLIFGGGLISYIYNRHVKDNDCNFEKNRQEHIRMYDKIDCKKDK